jgi:prolyl oligopeptidase
MNLGSGNVCSLHADQASKEVIYKYTSFNEPGSIWHYDIESGETKMWRNTKVNGLDLEDFEVEQVFVPSKDGKVKIPMFIVRPSKGYEKNGENVALLYGYGGFNISLGPFFSSMQMA